MKKTIGILAHVDAGKTTFSEQLLYYTGSIRNLGRVDYKTSYLDTDEVEQKRGITIFADQGVFQYDGDTYYLIDTPGHVDFSAETERVIRSLDYAILLISGTSGVQAHTTTLFRLLYSYKVPTFIFINKTDIQSVHLESVLEEIKNKLTENIVFLESNKAISTKFSTIAEFVAERDEEFLEAYLNEDYTEELLKKTIVNLIRKQLCFLVMSGSALKGEGINGFLKVFSRFTVTNYEKLETDSPFIGKVYKIRHDDKGNKLTFIKALRGALQVRNEFKFEKDKEIYSEKVNEIRVYNGKKYESVNTVLAGDVFAVTGLKTPVCGISLEIGKVSEAKDRDYRLVPALQSKIKILDDTDVSTCLEKLRILESEDPMLSVLYLEETEEILMSVMGKIQLEVLEQIIAKRFHIPIEFESPQIQYKETITAPVVGYGHFEPLRHYSEVQLRLEPNAHGSGITFESECPVDLLTLNYQRAIHNHIFEKVHKGILTGSPITDIKVILQNGRAHIKHTEGGDFREATYRAIRQGLEKSESILLEPFYRFEIYIEEEYIGKVLSDIQRLRGSSELPRQIDKNVCISGRGPVESFMEYGVELISFTKGTGSISLLFDGYDACQNAEEVIEKIGYNKDRDVENTSSSVFCVKGTSFIVPWYEAEKYMHTL